MTYREIYRFVVIVALTGLIACKFRKEPEPVFYNETFQWKIIIPENLTALNSEKWRRKETEDDATQIFAFYDGQYNAIEATAEPFDPEYVHVSSFVRQTKFWFKYYLPRRRNRAKNARSVGKFYI